jgi:phage/plasmid-like protein (TIGR03299 family)
MAHNIQTRDIQTGVEIAWHKLTNVVDEVTRENSGIAYPMEMRPLYYLAGIIDGNPIYAPSGSKQTVALDDGQPIGPAVNDSYQLISNAQMFDTIQASLEGVAHRIVSAGSVEDRTKAFVSVELNSETFTAAGRATKSVLNFLWGHGGKLSVRAKSGFTVVVCANTLALALAERGEFALTLRHTSGAVARLAGMATAVQRHLGVQEAFRVTSDRLAAVPCTSTDAREIFAGLLARPARISDRAPEPMSTRAANQVDALAWLFSHGKGNDGLNYADLFHAYTDYYSHQNSGGNDSWRQYVSSEFGSGATAKAEFYRLLGETVSDKRETQETAAAELAEVVTIGRQTLALR